MKKNKPYYLKMYNEWMLTGEMPQVAKTYVGGLCGAGLYDDALFKLMGPASQEHNYIWYYWGSWPDTNLTAMLNNRRNFTPFRQTILLFMAAMNNEL